MYVYYKCALYGPKLVVLSFVDYYVYCYTSEELEKWFVDTLENTFHLNFLVFSHWFMLITISELNYHSISVDQGSYATSIVEIYI